ncbi:ABC transporter permease [Rummeliibacillus pycnus]|uniref:ABC transporter permease n=1 Tax=Rummeliibacillus pycnus TaxID=101070 RepID=UPI000C9A44BB|nr:ABC transporter permease [Rummeliibacillus pycnus]
MFLALKELKHAKLRYTLMSVIIVLIAWLVFILSGLGNGLSTLSAAAIKNLDADYVVYEDGAKATFSKSLISESLINDIKKNKEVKDATPFGAAMAAISHGKSNEEKTDVAILGIKPGGFIEPKTIEGKQLDPSIKNGVIANTTLKDKGYKLGDEIQVDGSTVKLKIIGFVENETYNHLPVLFSTLNQWRSYAYAAPGSNNGIEDAINAVVLQAPNLDAAQLDKQIDGIETVTKNAAINGMPGYMEENGTILMMLAFLIVISAFVIAVFFYVITIQKTQQFGVMKAIGASNSFITKAIVSQVFVLSVVGILIGAALTYLTALVFPENMPFDLNGTLVVLYGIALLLISLLSSLISVRQITKIDPLTALGRVE